MQVLRHVVPQLKKYLKEINDTSILELEQSDTNRDVVLERNVTKKSGEDTKVSKTIEKSQNISDDSDSSEDSSVDSSFEEKMKDIVWGHLDGKRSKNHDMKHDTRICYEDFI
ncbi:hypothetical protein QTN25_010288 [Entamoeba marina]